MPPSNKNIFNRRTRKIPSAALLYFVLSFSICTLLSALTINYKTHVDLMSIDQLLVEKSIKVTEVISRLLFKTQALAALVIQNDGQIENFDKVAATIVDDPAILNILAAPNGIVANVYPWPGNERLIGFNLLDGSMAGNREALKAKELNQLVLGGPFNLMQGGWALVGRLPVWVETSENEKSFWGLVSVTLKYPQALLAAGLDNLAREGYAYEIWRINPDNNERQIIAYSDYEYNSNTPHREKPLNLFNAEWFIRILPVQAWYDHPENWVLIFISLAMSIMIALIAQNNHNLRKVKSDLEAMVLTDPLTGLLNRHGLFNELEFMVDKRKNFQLCYIDINNFKRINDRYGRSVGDKVLINLCRKIQRHLADNFLFARMSGDEFVLVRMGKLLSDEEAGAFWEAIEQEFNEPIAHINGDEIILSFSKGRAAFPEDGKTLDAIISHADKMLNTHKRSLHNGKASFAD